MDMGDDYCQDIEGHINPPAEGETPYHQMNIDALSSRLWSAFEQAFNRWMRSHPNTCQLIICEALQSLVVRVLADAVRNTTHNCIQAEEAVDMFMSDVRALLRAELGLDEQSYAEFSEEEAHHFKPPQN